MRGAPYGQRGAERATVPRREIERATPASGRGAAVCRQRNGHRQFLHPRAPTRVRGAEFPGSLRLHDFRGMLGGGVRRPSIRRRGHVRRAGRAVRDPGVPIRRRPVPNQGPGGRGGRREISSWTPYRASVSAAGAVMSASVIGRPERVCPSGWLQGVHRPQQSCVLGAHGHGGESQIGTAVNQGCSRVVRLGGRWSTRAGATGSGRGLVRGRHVTASWVVRAGRHGGVRGRGRGAGIGVGRRAVRGHGRGEDGFDVVLHLHQIR